MVLATPRSSPRAKLAHSQRSCLPQASISVQVATATKPVSAQMTARPYLRAERGAAMVRMRRQPGPLNPRISGRDWGL
jgi:hypothetical protein